MPDMAPGQLRLMQQYQRRFDEDFPRGLLASWDDPGGPEFTYPVPRVEVIAMRGLDPQVMLPVDDWAKTVEGVVVSYRVDRTDPCLVARVIFRGSQDRHMLWSAGVGPQLAVRLVPVRARLIRLASARGCSSLVSVPGSST